MAKYLGIPLQVASGTTVTPTYGSPDLVVDGDFPAGTTAWFFSGGASLETNGAKINNGGTTDNAYIRQTFPQSLNELTGKKFELTYDVIVTDGSILQVEGTGVGASIDLDTATTGLNRKLVYTWNKDQPELIIKRRSGPTNVTIDNVSLKEVSYVLGKEEVDNGDFSNGTTLGWGLQNVTADISNNTLKLTSTTSDNNRAYYNISTEVGKTYQMSVDVKSGATNSISGIGGISTTDPYIVEDGANAASFTTLKITFIATLTTTQIRLLNAKVDTWGGLGSIVEFDNVSVKEVQYNYLQVAGGDLLKESKVGDVVFNSTDDNEAVVVQVIDNDTLLLSNDVLSDAGDAFSIFAPNGDTRGNQILRIDNYIISEYDEATSAPNQSSFWFAAGIEADKVTLTQLNDAVNTYFVADIIERFVQRLNAQSATASRLDIPLNEFRDHKYNQVLTTTAITLS
eukprot:COSAG06_NODE_73_length_25885_cov_732.419569_29_plen_455_part_00